MFCLFVYGLGKMKVEENHRDRYKCERSNDNNVNRLYNRKRSHEDSRMAAGNKTGEKSRKSRKKEFNNGSDSQTSNAQRHQKGKYLPGEKEEDQRKVEQRQKQINYGKNTVGYDRYIELVPRNKRKTGHPTTPDKNIKRSKRSWDGLVRKWRKQLHEFDPKAAGDTIELSVQSDLSLLSTQKCQCDRNDSNEGKNNGEVEVIESKNSTIPVETIYDDFDDDDDDDDDIL